jgi:P27 family predicted phage terminase small subunit
MPGRRPKPTALHLLQGTYHTGKHRRDRAKEPMAEGELRDPPIDLTPTQEAAWTYAIAHAPKGVLHAIDREILRAWVETLDRKNEAMQLLEAEENAVLWLTSPAHRIVDRTTVILIRLAGELGFSPAARPRLRVEPTTDNKQDEPNPWARLRLLPGGKE